MYGGIRFVRCVETSIEIGSKKIVYLIDLDIHDDANASVKLA